MKLIFIVCITLLLASCTEISRSMQLKFINYDLNPIIGNLSLNHIPKEALDRMEDKEKIMAHLTYVHDYLVNESAHYPSEVKQKRLATLSKLYRYITAGQYPENEKFEGRRPCFIDASNTYCAVGYLVKETAGESLTKVINEKHQYDYIYDMDLAALDDWIIKSGFTRQEIAMIQPTYDFNRQKKYHTASVSTEVRNGNFPNYGWGYHYIKYQPYGSRLGGHIMRSYGTTVNFYQDGDWSTSVESERSLLAVKKIGLSLNSGLGAKYTSLANQHLLQGIPSTSINMVIRQNKRLFLDLGAIYQYSIPLVNQSQISLNRHAFVFRLRAGYYSKK